MRIWFATRSRTRCRWNARSTASSLRATRRRPKCSSFPDVMGLQGAAFLALWNDVDPARDAEYNGWHTFEHVPERVGIEGFLAARRYVARERFDDRYFTFYDVESLGVFAGPGYADVVDHPTEWSRSMRPSLRNFQRSPCTTQLTRGTGVAGSVATFRIGTRGASGVDGSNAARSALEPYVESSGIASIHLGLV